MNLWNCELDAEVLTGEDEFPHVLLAEDLRHTLSDLWVIKLRNLYARADVEGASRESLQGLQSHHRVLQREEDVEDLDVRMVDGRDPGEVNGLLERQTLYLHGPEALDVVCLCWLELLAVLHRRHQVDTVLLAAKGKPDVCAGV